MHCDNQHLVEARRGTGDGATRLMALLALWHIGIEVLQERKLTGGIHMRQRSGYTVWATEEESQRQGGIDIVCRDAEGWGVEGVRNFGTNVVSLIITSGRKSWYGVGAYIPPNDQPTINQTRQALECGPKWIRKLLVGDLYACLENPRDQQEEQLVTVRAGYGLTDQAQHFLPRQK